MLFPDPLMHLLQVRDEIDSLCLVLRKCGKIVLGFLQTELSLRDGFFLRFDGRLEVLELVVEALEGRTLLLELALRLGVLCLKMENKTRTHHNVRRVTHLALLELLHELLQLNTKLGNVFLRLLNSGTGILNIALRLFCVIISLQVIHHLKSMKQIRTEFQNSRLQLLLICLDFHGLLLQRRLELGDFRLRSRQYCRHGAKDRAEADLEFIELPFFVVLEVMHILFKFGNFGLCFLLRSLSRRDSRLDLSDRLLERFDLRPDLKIPCHATES